MRPGSNMSTRGERCAYFEGSAYLLDLRCFFAGRGNDEVVVDVTLVASAVVVRERFAVGRGDTDNGASVPWLDPLRYWYFAS